MNRSAPPPPLTRRRKLHSVILVAAIVIVPSVVAWIWIQSAGRSAREAALNRIKMAGDPLMPADLPSPPVRGKDPAEWLARLTQVQNAWDMWDLSDPSDFRKLLERARRRELGEDAREAFEQLQACIEKLPGDDPVASWNEFWSTFSDFVRAPQDTVKASTCQDEALRLLAIGLEPSLSIAREAASYGAIDPRAVTRSLDSAGGAFPEIHVEALHASEAVMVAAVRHARAKQFSDALDDLRVQLALARVYQPSQWLTSFLVWSALMNRALDTLGTLLPLLPRGLDVSEFETRLLETHPRDDLATALKGERAFGNRVLEQLRAGTTPGLAGPLSEPSILDKLHRKLIEDGDQAHYLDAMTAGIERISKPSFLRATIVDERPSTFWSPASLVMLPSIASSAQQADVLEARLALARAALTAYRGGAEAAFKFLANSVDPFDGRAIRCALSSEGLIAFWSIGPDKSDDGGKDPKRDIVWTLRLRE
jgi:hypothetical protein